MISPKCLLRLALDRRGVALVEFALVVPILLLMYLAGYQICDALSCNRKVTITARAVADLTTQNSSVSSAQLATILNASSKIMAPYAVSNAMVRVSELSTDSAGNTKVIWSQANDGISGRVKNSSYTLPTTIKTNGSFLVMSEVVYSYKPPVDFGIVKPLTLSDNMYMSPRVSASIDGPTT
jgi:Flp pilus assembly protein TadG